MTSLNGLRKLSFTAKETSIANCEVLDEKYRIAVQKMFSVGIVAAAVSEPEASERGSSLIGKNHI